MYKLFLTFLFTPSHFPLTFLPSPNFTQHPSGNFHKFTATVYLKLPHCIPLLFYNVSLNFLKRKMYFDFCDYLIIIVHLYLKKRFFNTLLDTFIIMYCYLYNIIKISRILTISVMYIPQL